MGSWQIGPHDFMLIPRSKACFFLEALEVTHEERKWLWRGKNTS